MGIIRQSTLKLHGLSGESAMALADEVAIAINAAVVATPRYVKIRFRTRPVTRRSPHLMDAARSPDIAANWGPQLLQSCWPPTGKSKCP